MTRSKKNQKNINYGPKKKHTFSENIFLHLGMEDGVELDTKAEMEAYSQNILLFLPNKNNNSQAQAALQNQFQSK